MIAKICAASGLNLDRSFSQLRSYGLHIDPNYPCDFLIYIDSLVELKEFIIDAGYDCIIGVPEKGKEANYIDFTILIHDDYIE